MVQRISKYLDVESISINNEKLDYDIVYSNKNLNEFINGNEEDENEDDDSTVKFDYYYITYASDSKLKKGETLEITVSTIVTDHLNEEEEEIFSIAGLINEDNVQTKEVKHILSNNSTTIIESEDTNTDIEQEDEDHGKETEDDGIDDDDDPEPGLLGSTDEESLPDPEALYL